MREAEEEEEEAEAAEKQAEKSKLTKSIDTGAEKPASKGGCRPVWGTPHVARSNVFFFFFFLQVFPSLWPRSRSFVQFSSAQRVDRSVQLAARSVSHSFS